MIPRTDPADKISILIITRSIDALDTARDLPTVVCNLLLCVLRCAIEQDTVFVNTLTTLTALFVCCWYNYSVLNNNQHWQCKTTLYFDPAVHMHCQLTPVNAMTAQYRHGYRYRYTRQRQYRTRYHIDFRKRYRPILTRLTKTPAPTNIFPAVSTSTPVFPGKYTAHRWLPWDAAFISPAVGCEVFTGIMSTWKDHMRITEYSLNEMLEKKESEDEPINVHKRCFIQRFKSRILIAHESNVKSDIRRLLF